MGEGCGVESKRVELQRARDERDWILKLTRYENAELRRTLTR
jgi:hypothetical protein